jgi:hypothetical protein
MRHERSCLCCKFFSLDMGDPGYSEYTPGSPAHIECAKRHFKHYNYGSAEVEMEKAKVCKDFIHR